MQLFPVPCKDYVQIKAYSEIVSLSLFNSLGQPVPDLELNADNTINTMDLAEGVYMLDIQTTDKQYRTKLIKE